MAVIICQGCESAEYGTVEVIMAWSAKHKCAKGQASDGKK